MVGFLTGGSTSIDFSAISDALTGSMNVGQIGVVVAAVLAASVSMVVFWWGARKLVNAIYEAFKSGKIKF